MAETYLDVRRAALRDDEAPEGRGWAPLRGRVTVGDRTDEVDHL
jgi:hypothetical protein